MNPALQTFQFQSHALTVVVAADNSPWFIAKEVAEILEYSDAFEMTKKLDEDEIQNLQIAGFGNRGVNLINESGLYSAVLTSQKTAAKPFKKWVTSEVLPAIRKTGGYNQTNSTVAEVANLALVEEINELQIEVAGLKDELLSLYRGKPHVKKQVVYKVPFEAIELMEKHHIPREEIIKTTGHDSNYVRQRVFLAKKAGRIG